MKCLVFCSRLTVLLTLAVGTFLGGCSSSRPVASNPDMYRQERIGVVDHWDTIADKVASRLFTVYERREDLITKPVYVTPPAEQPFSTAFYTLLKSRLTNKGMQVSDVKEPDCVVLEYDVQAVVRNPEFADNVPSLVDIGLATVSVFSGTFTGRTDTEIIITAKLAYRNRYAMHISMMYYIDDDDLAQYASLRPYDPLSSTRRTIRVQGR